VNPKLPNDRSKDDFVRRFGKVYEHSPWIARDAWRPGLRTADPAEIAGRMREVVDAAGRDRQLALLRAHPELAARPARRSPLTAESAGEQSGAGLDRCSPEEGEALRELNRRYRQRFGFPFILSVGGLDRRRILDSFRARAENSRGEEFRIALEEVHRIARRRIEQQLLPRAQTGR